MFSFMTRCPPERTACAGKRQSPLSSGAFCNSYAL
jgi:hypothetical protein